MSSRKLRYSFNKVLSIAENVECKDLHHKKAHQHKNDEVCLAEYEMHRHVYIIREYMNKEGI